MHRLSVYITEPQYRTLRHMAQQRGCKFAELLREGIELFIAQQPPSTGEDAIQSASLPELLRVVERLERQYARLAQEPIEHPPAPEHP